MLNLEIDVAIAIAQTDFLTGRVPKAAAQRRLGTVRTRFAVLAYENGPFFVCYRSTWYREGESNPHSVARTGF
jgi:hypothetical protein